MTATTTAAATRMIPDHEPHHQEHPTEEAVIRKSRTETALDWFQRCQQRRAAQRLEEDVPPETSAAAAWAFFRCSQGTGVSFVDESMRRCRRGLPAMEIRDTRGNTGKTRTLVSLAARFVVATRPSLFPATTSQQKLPRVIVCDSTLDVTALQLAHAVSSQLLRHYDSNNVLALEQDIEECLSRIHVTHVEDIRDWVPVLECLRGELLRCSGDDDDIEEEDFPTLLLWDGFLSEPSNTPGMQKEIARQLARLLRDCTVGLAYTRTAAFSLDSSLFTAPQETEHGAVQAPVTQIVILERDESVDRRHDFKATVVQGNQQIPYSLSAAGVLR